MDELQKEQIKKLRNEGYGYTRVAKILGISENTVKSYCRRNNLLGKIAVKDTSKEGDKQCCFCGGKFTQIKGRKPRKFCSDKCRIMYWKLYPDKMMHKKKTAVICCSCGKTFYDYERNNRKYCSHECYINDRYKDGVNND